MKRVVKIRINAFDRDMIDIFTPKLVSPGHFPQSAMLWTVVHTDILDLLGITKDELEESGEMIIEASHD